LGFGVERIQLSSKHFWLDLENRADGIKSKQITVAADVHPHHRLGQFPVLFGAQRSPSTEKYAPDRILQDGE
jgi:hypothetical protein